ncbi:hypothetical protein OnM2_079031 [Erysiphe neolycopersici]|uniref:Uncharacterized protein n=1 Tax=Erysiphe neolycopersici TaxID=212602 RepID=A0A420HGY7_9PEZI|nr:hypothetical protein OnM2_079031 [Erysiphe neolycopersici]
MQSVKKLKFRTCNNVVKSSGADDSTSMPANLPGDIFRQHFESQFKPLFCSRNKVKLSVQISRESVEEQEQVNDESDWNGFSDEEASPQIIEHTTTQTQMALMSKAEIKTFMSSKPPTQDLSSFSMTPNKATQDDNHTEAENIKNDIALHRFLSESHLLESAQNPTLSGNNRHKATDLRLLDLGSRHSILTQKNMPMAHRKGIIEKKRGIELKRRKNALENGIILEKVAMGNKKITRKRHGNAIGDPSVGRLSRGILQLSRKDIKNIQGPRQNYSRSTSAKKKSLAKVI